MVWRGELSFVALVRPIEWVYHNPEDMGSLQVRSGDHNCAGVDVGQLLHEWRS